MRRQYFRKTSLRSGASFQPVEPSPRLDRPRLPRKTLQLCEQVARTLESVLAEQGDAALRDLLVVRVEPAPDASRFLVTVAPMLVGPDFDPIRTLAQLEAASGRLRREIAAAITRRKTPALAFQLGMVSDSGPGAAE